MTPTDKFINGVEGLKSAANDCNPVIIKHTQPSLTLMPTTSTHIKKN